MHDHTLHSLCKYSEYKTPPIKPTQQPFCGHVHRQYGVGMSKLPMIRHRRNPPLALGTPHAPLSCIFSRVCCRRGRYESLTAGVEIEIVGMELEVATSVEYMKSRVL